MAYYLLDFGLKKVSEDVNKIKFLSVVGAWAFSGVPQRASVCCSA